MRSRKQAHTAVRTISWRVVVATGRAGELRVRCTLSGLAQTPARVASRRKKIAAQENRGARIRLRRTRCTQATYSLVIFTNASERIKLGAMSLVGTKIEMATTANQKSQISYHKSRLPAQSGPWLSIPSAHCLRCVCRPSVEPHSAPSSRTRRKRRPRTVARSSRSTNFSRDRRAPPRSPHPPRPAGAARSRPARRQHTAEKQPRPRKFGRAAQFSPRSPSRTRKDVPRRGVRELLPSVDVQVRLGPQVAVLGLVHRLQVPPRLVQLPVVHVHARLCALLRLSRDRGARTQAPASRAEAQGARAVAPRRRAAAAAAHALVWTPRPGAAHDVGLGPRLAHADADTPGVSATAAAARDGVPPAADGAPWIAHTDVMPHSRENIF